MFIRVQTSKDEKKKKIVKVGNPVGFILTILVFLALGLYGAYQALKMFNLRDYKFINYDYYYDPSDKSIKLNDFLNTTQFYFGVSNQYKMNYPEFENLSEYIDNKYFKIIARQANENYVSVNLRTTMFAGFENEKAISGNDRIINFIQEYYSQLSSRNKFKQDTQVHPEEEKTEASTKSSPTNEQIIDYANIRFKKYVKDTKDNQLGKEEVRKLLKDSK